MARVEIESGPGLEQLRDLISQADGHKARVGWFESAKYEDGTPAAYVASIQEFGYGNIPPRPFMRPTIAEKKAEWRQTAMRGAERVLDGSISGTDLMEMIAAKASGDISEAITRVMAPPLAEATLESRRSRHNTSTKPLVDTGIMFETLTWDVD